MADTRSELIVSRVTPPSRFQHTRFQHHRFQANMSLELSYSRASENPLINLNELIQTLKENEVPGPQLFRLRSEFTEILGKGGQSEVRGVNQRTLKMIQMVDKQKPLMWPVGSIAIKQHRPRSNGPINSRLGSKFLAAKHEVLALAPTLFQRHPNIVQLLGWGFCLDTIESAPPESFQIPLLILERADMNLYQFLQKSQRIVKHVRMHKKRPSFYYNISTILEPDVEAGSLVSLRQKFRVIRQLCIDIGNGLHVLHQHKFSHGDLKPLNVLVFGVGKRWSAKLCDFGCARGLVQPDMSGNEVIERRQRSPMYVGTLGWLPPEALTQTGDGLQHESLQKCDIYAYGLIVWSAFCKSGESPLLYDCESQLQTDLVLEYAIQDIHTMFGEDMSTLANFITNLLQDCLQCERGQRSDTPWMHLHPQVNNTATKAKAIWGFLRLSHMFPLTKVPRMFINLEANARVAEFSLPLEGSSGVFPSLFPYVKENYGSRWWRIDDASNSNSSLASPSLTSSKPLNNDDDFNCLLSCRETKREAQVETLYSDLVETLTQKTLKSQGDLYCYARFRSRIPLSWWLESGCTANVLENVISIIPIPEFATLAWLCRGEVGLHEVQRLKVDFNTWQVILTSSFLNESERLERFLLLLQFGARVEKRITAPSVQNEESILVLYIQSCPPTIVRKVTKEIFRRYDKVMHQPHIAISTRRYMSEEFQLDPLIKSHLAVLNHLVNDAVSRLVNYEDISSSATSMNESQPLLTLPPGWETVNEVPVDSIHVPQCYREIVTRSITFVKPTCSLLLLKQIHIRYNTANSKEVFYIDVAGFVSPEVSKAAKASLDHQSGERFPFYDDQWFKMEQHRALPTVDVLDFLHLDAPFLVDRKFFFSTFADRIGAYNTRVTLIFLTWIFLALHLVVWLTPLEIFTGPITCWILYLSPMVWGFKVSWFLSFGCRRSHTREVVV